jgi:hypothetical protein
VTPSRERVRWSDERGSVGRLIIGTVVLIFVVGLAVVETGSIIFTHLSLENTASDVAADAAVDINASHSANAACNTALQSTHTHDKDAKLVSCSADPKTGEVKVKLRKVATTLIVKHVGFLRKLGVVKATADTGPSP